MKNGILKSSKYFGKELLQVLYAAAEVQLCLNQLFFAGQLDSLWHSAAKIASDLLVGQCLSTGDRRSMDEQIGGNRLPNLTRGEGYTCRKLSAFNWSLNWYCFAIAIDWATISFGTLFWNRVRCSEEPRLRVILW